MPTWAWVITLFVGMSAAYWIGVIMGVLKSDAAPNAAVWLKAREYDMNCKKEIALESMREDAKWEMAALERGIYDNLPFDDSDDQYPYKESEDEDG